MWTVLGRVALAICLGLGATAVMSTSTTATTAAAEPVPHVPGPEEDPRVLAFAQSYAALIDSVVVGQDDVVFALAGGRVHFQDGRMLEEGRLERSTDCDPIFYAYPLGPLTEPPAAEEVMPTYCTDVQEVLWGRTEKEIRDHGRSISFLDHRMFVNELLIEPLGAVERDILDVARHDPAVAAWVDELDVTYSFSNREIAGSETRSQHGWGMAVDLVPRSYGGRAVYWRWSRVYDRDGWDRIPVERRWSPPEAVVEIFESRGFVWGGKWAHFDMIHFEYRPEILLYNRLAATAQQ